MKSSLFSNICYVLILKVSQSLVEMQIENNKIREEAEATKFELTNKVRDSSCVVR